MFDAIKLIYRREEWCGMYMFECFYICSKRPETFMLQALCTIMMVLRYWRRTQRIKFTCSITPSMVRTNIYIHTWAIGNSCNFAYGKLYY